MIEATMLDVSAGDQDVAMASSPYYHADAAMMDADYAQPETEEIDMDDDAAPEYEMADDEHYYDEHQPQIYDADIVDAPIDHAPQHPAVHPIDVNLPAEPAVLHELQFAPVSPAPVLSTDSVPAPVFAVSDVHPAAVFAEASHEPPSHVSPHPDHVSPLPLHASDLPLEHAEVATEPNALPSAAEPSPFSHDAVAPAETESTSHKGHSGPAVSLMEESALAHELQPTPETYAIPETLPGSELHAHDAPPTQALDDLAPEAESLAESHVHEPPAPGETTLVEHQVSYNLYEDDEGSDPSDEDLFVPPPTVAMSVQNEPTSNYVLFALLENASASATSSSTAYLFSDRLNLYYEPVSAVFKALRQIGDIEAKYEYCELAFCAPQLNLTIAEDSKHANEVSFHDFGLLHESFGLDGPLQVQLQSITPRFIKRFNFLRAEVAKMMSAAAQAPTDAEELHAAPTEEPPAEYYEEAALTEPLEPQIAGNNEIDQSQVGIEHLVDEAAVDSGYFEDGEIEPELYQNEQGDVAGDNHALGQHGGDGGGEEESGEDGDVIDSAPAALQHIAEDPAAAEEIYPASEQPGNEASKLDEPLAEKVAQPVGEAEAEEDSSGEGDEEYSPEYVEYEGEYDDGDVEGQEPDELKDDTNRGHDKRPVEQGHGNYSALVAVEEVYEGRQEAADFKLAEASTEYHDISHIQEEVSVQSLQSHVIDLTEHELETDTDHAIPEFKLEDFEEYTEGDNQTYSALEPTYEEDDNYEDGDDAAPDQQVQANDADAAEAYEEDDQATLSSSDDRAAQMLPSLSSKRSHDGLLREDPQFDGDGLGEDDHDSKRARVE